MSLARSTRSRTDDFQDMLLKMDFNDAAVLQQPQIKQPRLESCGAHSGSTANPFGTSTQQPGLPITALAGIQMPFTRQSTDACMLRSNLQSPAAGRQQVNDLILEVAQAQASQHMAQPDPLGPDSGSGEPHSRDRTGWDTATAGTAHDRSARGGKKQDKSERQQMLNKAAQQRYRERKKAKANELKQAVTSLQDKVEELSKVHAEKDELQEKVRALERELAGKEAHLATLQQTRAGALMPESGVTRPGSMSIETSSQCSQRYIEDVQKLKRWLGTHGYLSRGCLRNPLVLADIPTDRQTVLQQLARDCHTSCQQCLKKRCDMEPLEAAEGAGSESGQLHFQGDAAQWHQLVEQLVLHKRVREKALQVRLQYIKKLDTLFQQRRNLNIEAVKVLLPPKVGAMSLKAKPAISAPLFEKLSDAYATADILRRLRINLSQERETLSELDNIVYVDLLDCVQLSRCILTSFPQHCDAVSLLNAIYSAGQST